MAGNKDHWDKIYAEKKPDEVSWFQPNPEKSLELIRSISASKDDRIIDVGGGASLLAGKLLEAGFRSVTVLDISAKALQYARERLGPRAGQVTWITGDVTTFKADEKYDLWHDRAVFHFLTEGEDRGNYAARLEQSLRKGGFVVLAAFAKNGPDKCSNLPVRRYDEELVRNEFSGRFELAGTSSEIHKTPWGKEQKFGYFLLKKITD